MSTITKYAMVQSVKAFNTASKSYVQVPAQIKMEIAKGDKKQVVAFGFARTGGRGLFMTVDGNAPVSITRRDFLDRMRRGNVNGLDVILTKLSKLNSLHSDKFIVAKCECCGEATVTAANMDFMQRNHVRLSEKLNRTLNAFSKVCYACQGKGPKQPKQQPKQPAVVQEAPARYVAVKEFAAECAACGNGIESKRVAEFATREFGQPLCFGKCQNDAKKQRDASEASVTSPQPDTTSQPASEASVPFPDVAAHATQQPVYLKGELDAELASLSYNPAEEELDTADLNAVLDADAQVMDFLDVSGDMSDAAPKKKAPKKKPSELHPPMMDVIKQAIDEVKEGEPVLSQAEELAAILAEDANVMDFLDGADAFGEAPAITQAEVDEQDARALKEAMDFMR